MDNVSDEPTKGLDSILRDQIYEFFPGNKGAGKRRAREQVTMI